MIIDGWRYYNRAAIPTSAPHIKPDLTPVNNRDIWKLDGKPLFAIWTDNFDCGYETEWWYTIQDCPYELESVSSKVRKKINTGLRNFDCRKIDPKEYADKMADVAFADWASYPKAYRPNRSREQVVETYRNWKCITYGAFNEENELCAFNGIIDHGDYYEMHQRKSNPEKQKGQLNAALIYTNIMDLAESVKSGKYISNGQRNTNHKTNFSEDLCKLYGFRKAYCRLNIRYCPRMKLLVMVLYPFRRILVKFDSAKLVHSINTVLLLESICRSFKE